MVFITASDTHAGKSWLTAGLVRALLRQQRHAVALKPVACGLDAGGRNEDITALLTAQGLQEADAVNLYRFAMPAAPSLAAAADGTDIDPGQLTAWCRQKAAGTEICLVEGVGGLMVPLTADYLLSDWIGEMPEAEIWLVIGCRIGCINHALLTLARLEVMGRPPRHIIINAVDAADDARLESTRQALLPFVASGSRMHTLAHGEAPGWPPDEPLQHRR